MITTRNHAQLTATVREHVAADAVIQGDYWDPETQRGCFIGCLVHSDNPAAIEHTYGIPVMLVRIAETIFERLPADEAREFFAAFPAAVGRDGKDLSRVSWQFLAQVLRELPRQSAEAQSVIDPVIAGLDLLANGQSWADADADAAYVAAYAAARAAVYAADAAVARAAAAAAAADATAVYAADDAAARAAAAAADADADADADAAAAAAYVAARAAARRRQRDLLLQLVADA